MVNPVQKYIVFQVMETEKMIYLVTEYASGGEIFGMYLFLYFFYKFILFCGDFLSTEIKTQYS